MHTTEIGTANVPAFLTKLWKLVEDPMYADLITWSQNGRSFIIKNQSRFAKELLPLYFKHNNMASFIRQLNMYGFRKLTSIENSGLKSDKDDMEFFHQYFLKGQEGYLEFIKRKVATNGKPNGSNGLDPDGFKNDDFREILMDVKAIRDRQDTAENCLVQMQRENSALWREVAVLRQKHSKQQQIVERLIHFLVTLVQNQRIHPSMKRKMPLMIDDVDGITSAKRVSPKSPSEAIGGPVIHDVTNDVIDAELDAAANSDPIISMKDVKEDPPRPMSVGASSYITASSPIQFGGGGGGSDSIDPFDDILNTVTSNSSDQVLIPDLNFNAATPSTGPSTPTPPTFDIANGVTTNGIDTNCLDTPVVSIPSPQVDAQSQKSPQPQGMEMVASTSSGLPSFTKLPQVPHYSREYFTDHIDGVDTELNWLQDQLSAGSISIDPNALLGLFGDGEIHDSTSEQSMGIQFRETESKEAVEPGL